MRCSRTSCATAAGAIAYLACAPSANWWVPGRCAVTEAHAAVAPKRLLSLRRRPAFWGCASSAALCIAIVTWARSKACRQCRGLRQLQSPLLSLRAKGDADSERAASPKKKGKGRGKEPRFPTQISKALTQLLRHTAMKYKLEMRTDGYVAVEDVLVCHPIANLECTMEELTAVVRDSDKQRFSLEEMDGRMWIRANQGHSIKEVKDEQLLRRLQMTDKDLPCQVVHGTYKRHWKSIETQGLLVGGKLGRKFRNHVHFAVGLPKDGGIVSGMRTTCDVVIYLDVQRSLAEGLPLYRSANEVILTPGFDGVVPPRLFLRVESLKDGSLLWPL
mmetsp:Transcript_29219/g.67264  ORF Transcript_29219/g.67264 Transcript_29219/m.67264 type:complete len:331 (-) Transcript_29219:48-1040(-)